VIKNIGTTELIIIALILILLFGGKKIPEFIKGVGETVKKILKTSKDEKKE